MRSYYLEYAGNVPGREKEELEGLNERVLAFCVADVLGSINMFLHNRKEVLDFPMPISNPVNADVKGTKGAEFRSFF